ncbi:MAG: HypC/HybG/HupF family hydrogenase formation chaperone [Microthrixaceae bacterium]|nr:HypC/HybG/HupF family hydrogenase formation chaperone [Microthrixaceae bacterium]
MCLSDLGPVSGIDEATGTAEVDLAGRTTRVSLAPLVLEGVTVEPGDWLLVHTGLAVKVLDAAEAAGILAGREEMVTHQEPAVHETAAHETAAHEEDEADER